MAAAYPSGNPSFSPIVAGVDYPQAADLNSVYDEVTAIGTALREGVAHALLPDSTGNARAIGSSSQRFGLAYVKGLTLGASSELTIASGVVTATPGCFSLDTESNAASDDLDTITAGTGVAENSIVVLFAENVSRVVTVKDGTGNILLNGDCSLSANDSTLTLIYNGTNWREVARSAPSANGITNSGTDVTQIKFAGTQSASTDANTLDDYEEGSWTPVIGGSGGTSGQTYSSQVGRYVKIGKLVIAQFTAVFTAKGTITTSLQLQGLPFTIENVSGYAPVGSLTWVNYDPTTFGVASAVLQGIANSTTAGIYVTTETGAGAVNALALGTTTGVANNSEFRGTLMFRASA